VGEAGVFEPWLDGGVVEVEALAVWEVDYGSAVGGEEGRIRSELGEERFDGGGASVVRHLCGIVGDGGAGRVCGAREVGDVAGDLGARFMTLGRAGGSGVEERSGMRVSRLGQFRVFEMFGDVNGGKRGCRYYFAAALLSLSRPLL